MATLNPLDQFQKASDTRRKSDLAQIKKALENFYNDKGRYPKTTGNPYYCIQDFVSPFTTYCGGSSWNPYMSVVPKESRSAQRYVYYADSNGQTYYLYANLERGNKDPDACNSDGSACDSLTTLGISQTACGATCNYGVSSSNTTP